jgi:uncharacterized membrane-anchored protein
LYEARKGAKGGARLQTIYTQALLNDGLDEKQRDTAASWFHKTTNTQNSGSTLTNLMDAATELKIEHEKKSIKKSEVYDREKLERAILNDTRVYVLSILMRIGCSV